MSRRKPRKSSKPEFESPIWQFQLEPISEMDLDDFIAMDAYHANQAPIAKPLAQAPIFIDEGLRE